WAPLIERGVSVVWCPVSNGFLFGRTLPAREFLDFAPEAASHICLGSDSRVTGSTDLLDELRAAAAIGTVQPRELLSMVTTASAKILRLPEAGRLLPFAPADLIIAGPQSDEPASSLALSRRSDLQMVMLGGRPAIGVQKLSPIFAARRTSTARMMLDGEERVA